MNEVVSERILEIVACQFNVEKENVSSDSSLVDDLGADSMDIVELAMKFEEEFNVSVQEEKLEKLTVGGIAEYVTRKMR